MPNVAELRGLWRRSLIAWPDGTRDTTASVRWLQGLSAYIDLRQPTFAPDFSHARGLADLSLDDCAWLATQEGFSGQFSFDGAYFEWARTIDFQPKPLYSDTGSLWWEGNVLVEKGRDIAYIEHWHREEEAATYPIGAVTLRERHTNTPAAFLRVGSNFMFARDRAVIPPAQQTLSECVAAAPSLRDAQALVDCEISFGAVGPQGFWITASTLPYRIGEVLDQRLGDGALTTSDRDFNGDVITRQWEITGSEGTISTLQPMPAIQAL
jgi:hypothetical protein